MRIIMVKISNYQEKTLKKYADVWKATIRIPELSVANTGIFKSKKKAKEWLDRW